MNHERSLFTQPNDIVLWKKTMF